jgi:uncharacterized membrane protein
MMKAISFEVVAFLRKRPAWFVVSAWLLLLLTAFICFAAAVGDAARHYTSLPPQHHWANYDRAAVHLLFLAFWVALLTAIASSVSLGFGFRTAASALVATVWVCLIAGGTLRLALVAEGPEQFLVYSGQQKFLVPWRYIPQGSSSPSLSGFYVFMCPDSLLGEYDEGCHTAMQRLAIRPAQAGFEYFWEEKGIWKFGKIEMRPAGVRDGYQVSIGTTTASQRRQIQAIFFERPASAGSTHCLVICVFGSCRRQALIGNNILSYDASYLLSEATFVEWDGLEQKLPPLDTKFGDWDAIDQRLVRLVSFWIAPK